MRQITIEAVNKHFAYWRRFRNYLKEIQEIVDKPHSIPPHILKKIQFLADLALQGDGSALSELSHYPSIVRNEYYTRNYK